VATKLQTLKSRIEFAYEPSNDNLFDGIFKERSITGSGTYGGTDVEIREIDLSLADVYLYLATHPVIGEGGLRIDWSKSRLISARRALFAKHGLRPPEIANKPKTVSGERKW